MLEPRGLRHAQVSAETLYFLQVRSPLRRWVRLVPYPVGTCCPCIPVCAIHGGMGKGTMTGTILHAACIVLGGLLCRRMRGSINVPDRDRDVEDCAWDGVCDPELGGPLEQCLYCCLRTISFRCGGPWCIAAINGSQAPWEALTAQGVSVCAKQGRFLGSKKMQISTHKLHAAHNASLFHLKSTPISPILPPFLEM